MQLPFTSGEFFEVFGRYNTAVWPAQWLLAFLAVSAAALAVLDTKRSATVISAILAVLWAWMGIVYHIGFFAAINPVARLFGVAFLVAGAMFLWHGAGPAPIRYRPAWDARAIIGGVLIAYALVGYPLVANLAGQVYPRVPTFGAPCPTTIFTLGLLAWASSSVPWPVWIVPASWALVGTSAAISLGVVEDYGLLIAVVLVVPLIVAMRRRDAPAMTVAPGARPT